MQQKKLKKGQYSTELEKGEKKNKITTEKCGITRATQILHRAYAKIKNQEEKKNQAKQTKSKKEPHKIGRKKIPTKERKKNLYGKVP